MADQLRAHTQRLKRLLQIRQILADAAEAQVRESSDRSELEHAEGSHRKIQGALEEVPTPQPFQVVNYTSAVIHAFATANPSRKILKRLKII